MGSGHSLAYSAAASGPWAGMLVGSVFLSSAFLAQAFYSLLATLRSRNDDGGLACSTSESWFVWSVLKASWLSASECVSSLHRTRPLHCDTAWRVALERLPQIVVLTPTETVKDSSGNSIPPRVASVLPSAMVHAVSPLGDIFSRFFEHVSSATLPEAMLGMTALLWQDEREQKQTQRTATLASSQHAELLGHALRYMRISSVAYGPLIVNPVMFPEKAVSLDKVSLINDPAAMICDHAELDRARVRLLHAQPSSCWLKPAHYVVHDVERREAVVVVRGTLSVEDVVTDLGAEEVDFFLGGKAHQSILQSACNVLRSAAPVLEQLAGQVDSITFTGHSLGGGVAAYSAVLCSELLDGGAWPFGARAPEVHCFTFGAPGLCSLEVSRGLRGRITSFCNDLDIVPRLSFGHVLELHDRAMAARDAGQGEPRTALPPGSHGKLYPAGRCFIVQSDGAVAEVEPDQLAPHISLAGGRRLVSDHFPPQYEAALRAGLACATSDATCPA